MPSEPRKISFTVPLIPPSVNHYKMRTRKGVTFISAEAGKFKADFAIFARGKSLCMGMTCAQLRKLKYALDVTVYFGPKQRGDGDNLWKCLADVLKECAVIHSDAAVTDWIMRVRRDNANPRTEITIEALASV